MKEHQMNFNSKFKEALSYSYDLHRNQTRKGTLIPYTSHLMTVSSLIMEHGGDQEQAIAGLLHDAVEDQGGQNTLNEIRKKFGDKVANIVSDCTDAWEEPKPPWKARKLDYLQSLPKKPKSSILVSLADKTHNAESILFDKIEIGDAIWDRFTPPYEETKWYYRSLSNIFLDKIPGKLAERLVRAVNKF